MTKLSIEKNIQVSTKAGKISVSQSIRNRNGKTVLVASYTDPSLTPEEGCDKTVSITLSATLSLEDAVTQMPWRIRNHVNANYIAKNAPAHPELEAMVQAELDAAEGNVVAAFGTLCHRTWRAEETKRNYLRFYIKNVLTLQSAFIAAGNYTPDKAAEIAARILEACSDSKDSHTAANLRIQQANILFPNFIDHFGLTGIVPEYRLPLFDETPSVDAEHYKALPRNVLVRFAMLLEYDKVSNPLRVGAALMMCSLTRPAETVCPKFGEVLDFTTYGVYAVLWQAHSSVRVASLKTTAAYRLIIIPRFAMTLIHERRKYLSDLGYSMDEINDMYIVCNGTNLHEPASPGDLSSYVRQKINTAFGSDAESSALWTAAAELMVTDPDNYGTINTDVTAYILRRSGCTYLCNTCGLEPQIVDVLMGHLLRRKDQELCKEVRDETNWPYIADKMESTILDPDRSAHPAFAAYGFPDEPHTALSLPYHHEYRIILTEEDIRSGHLGITCTSLLPQDFTISFSTPDTVVTDITPAVIRNTRLITSPVTVEQTDISYYNDRRKEVQGMLSSQRTGNVS